MSTTLMSGETILTKINCWLKGDDKAFEAIFHHYQPRICRYVFKYLHNRTHAEDITTDILVKIWQKRKAITSAATFENYLFSAARNYLTDEWRKRIDALLSLETIGHPAATATDTFIYKELEDSYHRSLSGLPEQKRKIFLMHREDSLTYGEIAKQLGISPKTVENQISATLKRLRASLSQYLTILL